MGENKLVSIVIPTYNHLDDCLRPCVDSLLKFTDFTDKELVIVANGCKDGTEEYLRLLAQSYPFVRVVFDPAPLGYTKATNVGIRKATGEYVVLLNNDVVLLEQQRDQWVKFLLQPFLQDEKVAVTGPLVGPSVCGQDFVIFFCAMVRRNLFDILGQLDEVFTPGGGEDTDFCIRAVNAGYRIVQVPTNERLPAAEGLHGIVVGVFPIYHRGEATVNDLPNWTQVFQRNSELLMQRYSPDTYRRWKLSNNCERAVIGKSDEVPPRERTRYEWARDHLVGKKVFEVGCSSGYGLRMLGDVEGLDYLGIDKDEAVITYAKETFGDRFVVADVNTFELGQYDTIIAFEVLEHLENGREIAQRLKKHCRCLLASVPYDEPPGFWGPHHRMHHLTERDFIGFKYEFIDDKGNLSARALHDEKNQVNLMLMRWIPELGQALEDKEVLPARATAGDGRVTAEVATCGRYFTTLPLTLMAIINQTRRPDELIIFDDGEHRDLREVDPFRHIFRMFDQKSIGWKVNFAPNRGQVWCHEQVLRSTTAEFVWRLDDDNVPEPDCLEKLLENMKNPNVGAVGGCVLDPTVPQPPHDCTSIHVEDVYLYLNAQWRHESRLTRAEHLYSTFLYRREAGQHGYNMSLSRVGHREETMFSHEMHRRGWLLLIDPRITTWHLRAREGGIRNGDPTMWARDEQVFQEYMKSCGHPLHQVEWVVLNNALGDHLMFVEVLDELLKLPRVHDKRVMLACCYPDVFRRHRDRVELVSIAHAQLMLNDLSRFDVYKLGVDLNWKGHLQELYRKVYLK
jgi:GT2 family glycosyltransferase